MRNKPVNLLCSENKLAYLLTFFSLLTFVKTSEKRREFFLITIDNGESVLYICFKVVVQQPCRKGHTVILHCNFKCNNYE